MGYIKRKLIFMFTRFLMRRPWGRRLLLQLALRSLRLRMRHFLRDLAELCPIMRPAAAGI